MVNRVTLVGHLGADPEIRSTNSGIAVGNLRLATSHRVKDGAGDYREETEWHRVTCFGRTAEVMGQYARKGKQLHIEGRIHTRKWQDSEGNDRYSTEIVAERIQMLGSKGDSAPQSRGYAGSAPADDVPF